MTFDILKQLDVWNGTKSKLVVVVGGVIATTIGFAGVIAAIFGSMLGDRVDSLVWGMATQNSISVIIVISLAISGPPLKDLNFTLKDNKWIILSIPLAAVIGSYFLTVVVLLPPRIGFSLFFVCCCITRLLLSITLELTGFLWTEKKPVSITIIIGSCITIIGGVLVKVETFKVRDRIGSTGRYILDITLALIAGVIPILVAIQCKLATELKSPFRAIATTQFFSTGLTLILAAIINPTPNFHLLEAKDWWRFSGGIIVAYIVITQLLMSKIIGLPALFCCIVFGELLLSYIVDSLGLLGQKAITSSALRIVGLVLVFCGVTVVQFARTGRLQAIKPSGLNQETSITDSQIPSDNTTANNTAETLENSCHSSSINV